MRLAQLGTFILNRKTAYQQAYVSSGDLPHPFRVQGSLQMVDFSRTVHFNQGNNILSLDVKVMHCNLGLNIL